MRVAIIGAGMGGLTAAYELSKAGYDVTVFEQSAQPGGLGEYIKIGNNYIERYYHHFFQSDTEIINYANELGIGKKLKFYPAKTGIFIDNTIFPFSSPLELLRYKPLSFVNRIRCGFVLAFLKFLPIPLKSLDNISAEKWLFTYAGKDVYEKVWKQLIHGKFSDYATKVPALWLWGRVHDRSLKLGYFDGSVKILFDRMIQRIKKNKGTLHFQTCVTKIDVKKNVVAIHFQSLEGGTTKTSIEQFDACIITALSPVVEKILGSKLSSKDTKNLVSNDHLGAVCLILELDSPVQDQYWLNICEKNADVLVMVEHTNMLSPRDYGGKSVAYLANYIHRDDLRFNMSDKEIIETYSAILKKSIPHSTKNGFMHRIFQRFPKRRQSLRLEH